MNKYTDVIIIGAGLSGTYVALNLPTYLNVTILSLYKDNSSLAQGGIASCLGENDSYASHIKDTLIAGHYVNDKNAVKALVTDGPRHITSLIKRGIKFDSMTNDYLDLTLEGGHSHKRILHINGDQTGKELMEELNLQLNNYQNITRVNHASVIRLLKSGTTITGIIYEQNNQLHQLNAQFVVLATGGIGDLYSRTTNQEGSIGLGLAIASKIGVQIRDMCYMQFHPTAYYDENTKKNFLLTEALRGEGAHLVDHNMKRFMSGMHKDVDLAPRDIVSQAIVKVMIHTKSPYIYLDTRHLDSLFLKKRFPNIYVYLEQRHLILGKDLVPITPVAHYTIGGIIVTLDGRTNISQLYACGEVTSSGVHGANRLASNSLLECLVYGGRIAKSITKQYQKFYKHTIINYLSHYHFDFERPVDLTYYKKAIQTIMTTYVGIVRTSPGLIKAKIKLETLLNEVEPKRYDSTNYYIICDMFLVALMVINDALIHDSLGCHQKTKEKRIC